MRNYQVTGYRFLRTLDAYGFGGILADDMGLVKTLQVINGTKENRKALLDEYKNYDVLILLMIY